MRGLSRSQRGGRGFKSRAVHQPFQQLTPLYTPETPECSWLTQAAAAIHFFEAAGSLTSSLYLNSSEGAQRSSRMVLLGVSFQVVTLLTKGAV